jgi:hexosaminidase
MKRLPFPILFTIILTARVIPQTEHTLMPVPEKFFFGTGVLLVDSAFSVSLSGYIEPRLERAATRTLARLSLQTGIPLSGTPVRSGGRLEIHCDGPAEGVQSAIEDESYTLMISAAGARLSAARPYGILRGLETFLQLVESGREGFHVREVQIEDKPRFPWRGVLIDVCRHWIPMDVLKRNIDAMAAVKMNVLHWHLTEDQGFRIESKRFPRLHQMGSDGKYFTQDQVREIIAYARDRGIRVVPEFDMPGHTTSWFVGHPELASAPGPYAIERGWGIFDPTIDPTREDVYNFLFAFIGEMAVLFPDPYFHIGGDEVSGKHWDANPAITEFKRKHAMLDNHDLQAYFNKRVSAILQRHGKRMVGWDEIMYPDLPKDIVVQSWRGQKSLAAGARDGYTGILSYGYYLDHIRPASFHYQIDPLGAEAADLNGDGKRRILGGEACMWAEFVTAENIDSRIWPRTAAIAERLWSPESVRDTNDMYRRLEVTSGWLEWLGVTHRSSYPLMLQRLTNHKPIEALQTLSDVLEPVKFYERPRARRYTSFTPLNRLVDATRPESDRARVFATRVDEFLADPERKKNADLLHRWLSVWEANHAKLEPLLSSSGILRETVPLSQNLSHLAAVGLKALESLQSGKEIVWDKDTGAMLDDASKPHAELLIMVAPAIRKLVEGAGALR